MAPCLQQVSAATFSDKKVRDRTANTSFIAR